MTYLVVVDLGVVAANSHEVARSSVSSASPGRCAFAIIFRVAAVLRNTITTVVGLADDVVVVLFVVRRRLWLVGRRPRRCKSASSGSEKENDHGSNLHIGG